jgi:alpha-glucosidase (family GH31 glycosyl hydrolase)
MKNFYRALVTVIIGAALLAVIIWWLFFVYQPAQPPGEMAMVTPTVTVAAPTPTAIPRQVERAVFTSGENYLAVEFLDDDLVHFEIAPGTAPQEDQPLYSSPMVFKRDYPGPTSFSTDGNGTLETTEIRIQIDPQSLCITAFDKSKEPDLKLTSACPFNLDKDFKGLTLTPESFSNAYGLGEKFVDVGTADGDWVGRQRFPGEFGNVQEPFNNGNVGNDQFPIAYFAGQNTDSYALFVDNQYRQFWDFSDDPWRTAMGGQSVRFYLMTGPDLKDLRSDYLELVGRPPVPPKKAFGLWVSEYGFDNWAELEDKLRTLRENHFPIDGFILDLQWYGGITGDSDDTRMGSLTWDESNFPDPAQKIASLKDDQGIGIVTIEQPYVGKNLPAYARMAEQGYLVRQCETCDPTYLTDNPWWGKGGMLDYSNPEAGAFWHDWKREPLIEAGVTGHWTDLGEPEAFDPKGWYWGVAQDGQQLHDQAAVHNLYNLLWSQSIYEGYLRNGHEQRPFILSRSGTSGSQRYGSAMWSGDISGLLTSLAAHLNVQMHMSMSGVDYYGSDIGGFFRQGGLQEETYTQWFADGTALDVPVRPHTFNLDNYLETAPDRVGDFYSNLENLRQRYELVPYLYSLAHRAYQFGEAVFPPLVYAYPEDPEVREMGSEKLIGRDLLVAMVAKEFETERKVYLPAGTWVNYHSGEWIDSAGEWIGPLTLYPDGRFKLPMFARAGAILPQMFVDENTMNVMGKRLDGTTRDELILQIYADSTPSSFTLYEDDGESMAYQAGEVRTTEITQQQSGQSLTVTIAGASGTYAGAIDNRDNHLKLFTNQLGAAESVTLNGEALPQAADAEEFESLPEGWLEAGQGLVWIKSGSMDVSTAKTFSVQFSGEIAEPVEAPAAEALPAAWPDESWQVRTPQELGLDSQQLLKAVEYVQEQRLNINNLLVARNGYLVLDGSFYRPGSGASFELEAPAQSVLSALVGIAIDQGYIESVEQPLMSFFPDTVLQNADSAKQAITLEHLLSMTSGLACTVEDQPLTEQIYSAPDWVQLLLDLPLNSPPGEQFNACDPLAHLVSAVLQQATGMPALDFAQEQLFAPLGIEGATWQTDPQGVNMGWRGLHLSLEQSAKFGHLYLNQGRWQDKQVLPAAWVETSTQSQVSINESSGYGYLWWVDPSSDVYFAWGPASQALILIPSQKMLVAMNGALQPQDQLKITVLLKSLIAPAVKSTGPIAENAQSLAELNNYLASSGQGPEETPVPPLPETAARISGKSFVFEDNPAGWHSVSLVFDEGPQALLYLTMDGQTLELPIGLDNIPRILTIEEPSGELPALAVTGSWQTENIFVVDYAEVFSPLTGRLTFTYEGENLSLFIDQGALGSLTLQGRQRE